MQRTDEEYALSASLSRFQAGVFKSLLALPRMGGDA